MGKNKGRFFFFTPLYSPLVRQLKEMQTLIGTLVDNDGEIILGSGDLKCGGLLFFFPLLYTHFSKTLIPLLLVYLGIRLKGMIIWNLLFPMEEESSVILLSPIRLSYELGNGMTTD